ncbi:unnamed protein product [Boreogadus saida]
MAAAMKAQKTGLLELRVTVDRWIRVLATLSDDTLTISPGEVNEDSVKPNQTPVGAVNGDPPNLSLSPVPDTITNVKRTVRVTKQDVGGLGISIKVVTSFLAHCQGKAAGLTGNSGLVPQMQSCLIVVTVGGGHANFSRRTS